MKPASKKFYGIVSLSFLAILLAVTVVTLSDKKNINSDASYTRVTSNCKIKPACLDAKPRCLIVEPVEGWCPASSIHPFPTQPSKATPAPILKTVAPVGTPVRSY